MMSALPDPDARGRWGRGVLAESSSSGAVRGQSHLNVGQPSHQAIVRAASARVSRGEPSSATGLAQVRPDPGHRWPVIWTRLSKSSVGARYNIGMSTTTTERHEFQTEVRQLLDLMVHSLYSHKDVVLRELISN